MDKFSICLDIGGTKILGAIFNKNRDIVYRLKKKTKAKKRIRMPQCCWKLTRRKPPLLQQ